MRFLLTATIFAAAVTLSAGAFAQEQPASTDGKSVPMQDAPAKIKPGKSTAKRHATSHHAKKKM